MTWLKFKNFLPKNFGNFSNFVDNFWSKFKCNLQYHSKFVLYWISHLKYLQFMLLEFDTDKAAREFTMIKYF